MPIPTDGYQALSVTFGIGAEYPAGGYYEPFSNGQITMTLPINLNPLSPEETVNLITTIGEAALLACQAALPEENLFMAVSFAGNRLAEEEV